MVLVFRVSLLLALSAAISQNVCYGNKEKAGNALFPSYKKYANHEEEEEENDHTGLKTFAEVETRLRSIIDEVIRKVLPYVIRASADIRLSGKCMASIFKLVIGMQKLQDWAIKMVDATGKPPSGVLQGTSMALGDFDECLNIQVERPASPNMTREEYFHGKYCMVELRMPKGILDAVEEYVEAPQGKKMNTSIGKTKTFLHMLGKFSPFMKIAAFRFGVCIPSTCNEEDLGSIVNTATKQIGFPLKVLHCQEAEKLHFRTEQTIILSILALLILPVLIGTAGEFYFVYIPLEFIKKKNKLKKLCTKLSIISNTKKLFDVNETKEHPFPVARGLLFLTVVFNIFAHTYVLVNHLFFFKYSNLLNFFEFLQDFTFSFVANGSNGIENYFFIIGFLLTYVRWKQPMVTAKIDFINLLVKPYIRLTLLQLFGIGLLLLLPLVGHGPHFRDFVGPYLDNCRTRWWANLFYIQNYWEIEEICIYHTWVFAVVMQMYVISIVILWLLIRKPNLGISLILAMIIIGMAIVGATVFLKKLPGALSPYFLDLDSGTTMFNSLFTQPFDHVGAFCIGLLTGFLLPRFARSSFVFKPMLLGICWCVSLASLLAVIVGLFEYRNRDEQMNPNVSLLYAMLNRNVYALFLSWFFVACATGNAAFFPDLFSWKAMIPGYRLSLLAYIIHLIIIYHHVGIMRERVYLSHEENVLNYFGYLLGSYLLAFVCYVFFQAPYLHLERFVSKKLRCVTGSNAKDKTPEVSSSFSITEQENNVEDKQKKTHLPLTLTILNSTLSNTQSDIKNT